MTGNINEITKRRYEERLIHRLMARDDFLIKRLEEEWGEIQKTAKKEEIIRRSKETGIVLAKTILILLAIAGGLTVAVVAPNVFSAFGRFSRRRGFFEQKNFRTGINYLKGGGLIDVKSRTKNGYEIEITKRGRNSVLMGTYNGMKISKSEKWDGVWRLVAFDIPNRYKWSRDGFRKKIRSLGFYQLQESLFVIPYDCEEEIWFIVGVYNITSYVRFIKTSYIDNDEDIKEHFGFLKN